MATNIPSKRRSKVIPPLTKAPGTQATVPAACVVGVGASAGSFEATQSELTVNIESVQLVRHLEEELKRSKEELRSLNQRLETKVHQLKVAVSDQRNLLVSSDIATICLDESLRIKWFTPATQRQFNFLTSDVGRPIADMLDAIGDAGLVIAARGVLAKQPETDRKFQTEGGLWYMRRVLPYLDELQETCGVIVTITDITDSHLAFEAAEILRLNFLASVEKSDRLRILSAALMTAEDRERRLLAQDLHDDLGQHLAIVNLKIAMLQDQEMPTSIEKAVAECAKASDNANRNLRNMALRLSPPMLEHLDLVPAMRWLADEVSHLHNIEIHIEDDGAPKPMEQAVRATLFRAVRELLDNVSKHGLVPAATVSVVRNTDGTLTLTLTLTDAGSDFDPDKVSTCDRGSFGLISLRERLGYLGGQLVVRSIPGHGTSVIVKVPLRATAKAPVTVENPA